jgi:hypothetical protein
MKPHIYKINGRWVYSTYGVVLSTRRMSLTGLRIEISAADDFCKRMNRKLEILSRE